MIFHRRLRRRCSGLTVLIMFLSSLLTPFVFVKTASAAPSLGLRWANNLAAQYGWDTRIQPLAADLNNDGKMEIVLTAGPANATSGAGLIAALDPMTGRPVWLDTAANISTLNLDEHCPFEIADLIGDGKQEIVVSTLNGPLALYGNGSLYWRRTDVNSGYHYLALCDIDGNGHPEIFVSGSHGPSSGYDYLTCLSYDGQVRCQGWSWYPCWGGLTVGDPSANGKFIVFQGDRSYFAWSQLGPRLFDPYKGGGMGIHAYDAFTLKLLWSDPAILCSSQVPILADVDKNGGLEVIVADQYDGGIVVLNASDGTVDTTNGIYRSGPTGMPAHSTPTVYDIDGDGNLELISCHLSPVQIWDLYNWRLKATLSINMDEPPKLGKVTADGKMDIICPVGNSIYIYSFDNMTGTYTQTASATVPQRAGANTLVEDLDGDGYNELIVPSETGYIYCFNTPGPAQFPQPRSGLQFYSERRCGAAVYVPPFTASAPVLRDEQPQDGTVNQTYDPVLTIRATSFQNKTITGTFSTNATGTWKNLGNFSGPSGLYSVSTSGINAPGTTYYWTVTCNQGNSTTTRTYSFTTCSASPSQETPTLSNDGNNNLTCSNQNTSDPNNDPVTNICNWQVNGTSIDTVNLPFDTRTTNNPLVYDNLTTDGFENGFADWSENGGTTWDQNSTQKHSGTYSAHAGKGDQYLTSNDTDTSSAESLTVSFWYRDHGFGGSSSVSLQFWNGYTYNTIFTFTSANPSDTWQWYSVQTYNPQYLIHNFRVRFSASGIGTGDFWLDNFAITCPARTKDYSGYNNYGTVHQVTWTPNGVQGGAYIFNGINSYVRVNDNPSLGGDGTWSQISIEFWIKPSSYQNGAAIIAKRDPIDPTTSESDSSYMIAFDAGGTPNTLDWGINNGSGWDEATSGATVLAPGNWYYVACTYESGTGLNIYINGTQEVNVPLEGNIMQSKGEYLFGAPLFIGSDGSYTQNTWLNATLDEVHIYNRALSPAQILQRYLDTKDGLSSNSTIVWRETKTGGGGGTWSCQITPNNSFGDGQTKPSNSVVTSSAEDIAIIAVEPQETAVPAGTPVTINTTVENHGGYSATWNITFDADRVYGVVQDETLLVDTIKGWNQSMPGPTISVVQNDLVNLTLLPGGNGWWHEFYVDYNNNSLIDSNEPSSPVFWYNENMTYSFIADRVGNFTYYDAYYQGTMFGLLVVSSGHAQIGSKSIELDSNKSATLIVSWNTIGFAIGNYALTAYAWPALDETDTADNSLTSSITVIVEMPKNPMPSVSISPSSIEIGVAQSQLFTSNVSSGTPPYSYQWYQNDTPVSGATAPTWTFNATSTGSYMIYVEVNDSIGMQADSNTAIINMNVHDTALISATPSKTALGQGYSLDTTVTIADLGSYPETFNTTVYANTTTITSQSVTLSAGNSTTITFSWNTTGVAYGNYAISACATPVTGETNTTVNNCTGGMIQVTIPGDIDGDFKVSLADLVLLANAYGTTPASGGTPRAPCAWNPNADVDGNGVVGLSDLVIMAQHYGQTVS